MVAVFVKVCARRLLSSPQDSRGVASIPHHPRRVPQKQRPDVKPCSVVGVRTDTRVVHPKSGRGRPSGEPGVHRPSPGDGKQKPPAGAKAHNTPAARQQHAQEKTHGYLVHALEITTAPLSDTRRMHGPQIGTGRPGSGWGGPRTTLGTTCSSRIEAHWTGLAANDGMENRPVRTDRGPRAGCDARLLQKSSGQG